MGGMSKFFDGYDWDNIILIDDPVTPDAAQNSKQIQMFKTIINEHNRIVEVKGGSMHMDTGLIIITANITPNQMANACGPDCAEAIYRRITKAPGAFYVRVQDRNRLCKQLISIIAQRFELDVNIEAAFNNLEPCRKIEYDLTHWFGQSPPKPKKKKVQQIIELHESSDEESIEDWENDEIPYSQLSPDSKHKRWANKMVFDPHGVMALQ